MDEREAIEVAEQRVAALRALPYTQLVAQWLGRPRSEWAMARSGTQYALEIEAVWDDAPHGDLRVWVLVDDGGPTAQRPIQRNFIMASDGTYVDE
jgi:hypothetical protein